MPDKKADTRNIYQRIAAAMETVKYVQKSNTKSTGLKYNVVTHDAVTAKVRPALLAEGVVYHPHQMDHSQNGNRTEVFLMLRFVNIAKPDDVMDVPCLGYGVDGQDKGPGKAVSYAVKYGLLKALGLETGDDADLDDQPHEISAEQFTALRDLVETTDTDATKFLKHFGAASLETFPPAKLDEAMAILKKKQTAKANQPPAAGPDEGDNIAADLAY